jgi:hypothetical protein
MRYREINNLDDISHDAGVVVDFIGEKEYRQALEKIGTDLNSKGFVTPFDDALFGLELDLLNLERLRTQCSGRFAMCLSNLSPEQLPPGAKPRFAMVLLTYGLYTR